MGLNLDLYIKSILYVNLKRRSIVNTLVNKTVLKVKIRKWWKSCKPLDPAPKLLIKTCKR